MPTQTLPPIPNGAYITAHHAKLAGFKEVTQPYSIAAKNKAYAADEQQMLNNAIADAKRSGRPYYLTEYAHGSVSLWAKIPPMKKNYSELSTAHAKRK